jgi:hypothetical protein
MQKRDFAAVWAKPGWRRRDWFKAKLKREDDGAEREKGRENPAFTDEHARV